MFLAVLKTRSRIKGPIPKRDLTLYHPLQRAKEGECMRKKQPYSCDNGINMSQEQRPMTSSLLKGPISLHCCIVD